LGSGLAHKLTQRAPEAAAVGGRGPPPVAVGQLPQREALHQDAVQQGRGHAARRATALSGSDGPRPLARGTLPATVAEAANRGPATGGFRMLRTHACELTP
jgi:hypothetical protein